MPRIKRTTLFNKNHIKIEKVEYADTAGLGQIANGEKLNAYVTKRTVEHDARMYTPQVSFYKKGNRYNEAKSKTIITRKASPLGFYYNHEETVFPKSDQVPKNGYSYRMNIFTFNFGNGTYYTLTYYTSYNNISINVETRPWDIADKSSMPDHQITSLIKVITEIIETAKLKKLQYTCKRYTVYGRTDNEYYTYPLNNVKNEIFTDLFGYKDGPKGQTDEMKLLAHGFDLKMSFRRRPEK